MGTTKYYGVTAKALAVAAIAITMTASAWAAGKEKVLLSFQGPNGGNPTAGVIADAEGNLYGAAADGGEFGFGNVFKLTQNKNGTWTQTVLYSFKGDDASDGQVPLASLILDGEGNLYGTTGGGGTHPPISDGTVFKLTPTKSGAWTETILHSFNCTEGQDDNDGCAPYSYLVFDKAGNLYGTTNKGGGGDFTTFCQNGCGTVFKLAPNKDGTWTESLIHTFPHGKGGTPDGQNPYAGLIIDDAGNLYGTTYIGGHDDAGVVFKLTPNSNGTWKETVLFSFRATINNPKDGLAAYAGLTMDKSGNLYGTTRNGGGKVTGGGTVYKLTPTAKGEWQETVIHAFPSPRYHDGEIVLTGVTMDAAGNLYGATTFGGGKQEPTCQDFDGCGVVYKLSPNADGTWSESILHAFQNSADGGEPELDRLLVDSAGNVYGTTFFGGTGAGGGTVFEITP